MRRTRIDIDVRQVPGHHVGMQPGHDELKLTPALNGGLVGTLDPRQGLPELRGQSPRAPIAESETGRGLDIEAVCDARKLALSVRCWHAS
jgi:hypothetical protein